MERENKQVLITGGTSGLGKELVKSFLNRGFQVAVTGRQPVQFPGFENKFRLFQTDFSDLRHTSEVIKSICESFEPDFVISNAGILSPPEFIGTIDEHEMTFQVNFLAHLLINEIIISKKKSLKPLIITATTSPVYRLPNVSISANLNNKEYNPVRAYSSSKLYLALMCRYLSLKYSEKKVKCFSFDPGIFGSGIYRSQNMFFRTLYRIAAPFMRQPKVIATVMSEIITDANFEPGGVYNIRKRIRQVNEPDKSEMEEFWIKCYEYISTFLV
jgi:NAD(P)-dependent dehydrogenase (short-subunit alcohol dehydrogenase family)